jgi:ubiquinone/menaquinone biosynthesis C-methylase UbiE
VTREAAQRFDGLAANFATSEVHRSSPTMTRLHELLSLPPAPAVCDVACGAGHLGLSFAPAAGEIVSVDPAPHMLAAVRTLAAERGAEVETVQAPAESLPLEDDRFDFVGSRLAPHHFADLNAAVAEMARVARPGGSVAVIDLEGHEDPAIDDLNHRLELLHDPTHVRSYTAAEWRAAFEQAGLAVEVLESDHHERPAGVPVHRWCEIASSGADAEAAIRTELATAPPDALAALGIVADGDDFRIPVRTVLVLARKDGGG